MKRPYVLEMYGLFQTIRIMDLQTLITKYCAYQERCQKEVRNKLYESGARKDEVEELMIMLITEGLVDEERYARAYARGKFRIKNWGRNKIVYELKQNQISEYCIKKGLAEIDEDEYRNTVRRLAEKKMTELKGDKNLFSRRSKLWRYLSQKGYEHHLITNVVSELISI